MNKHSIRFVLFCLPVALFFFSCAGQAQKRSCLLDSEINIADFDERLYNYRTWYPPADLPFNPIGFGKQVDIPVNQAKTKEEVSVGDVATGYDTLLFLHDGNKRLRPVTGGGNPIIEIGSNNCLPS